MHREVYHIICQFVLTPRQTVLSVVKLISFWRELLGQFKTYFWDVSTILLCFEFCTCSHDHRFSLKKLKARIIWWKGQWILRGVWQDQGSQKCTWFTTSCIAGHYHHTLILDLQQSSLVWVVLHIFLVRWGRCVVIFRWLQAALHPHCKEITQAEVNSGRTILVVKLWPLIQIRKKFSQFLVCNWQSLLPIRLLWNNFVCCSFQKAAQHSHATKTILLY